jgi:hypothetical protein
MPLILVIRIESSKASRKEYLSGRRLSTRSLQLRHHPLRRAKFLRQLSHAPDLTGWERDFWVGTIRQLRDERNLGRTLRPLVPKSHEPNKVCSSGREYPPSAQHVPLRS